MGNNESDFTSDFSDMDDGWEDSEWSDWDMENFGSFKDKALLSAREIKTSCKLHDCVKKNRIETLRHALQNGGNVNCSNGQHNLLTLAASYDRTEIVKVLLEFGAKVSIFKNFTPLSRAIQLDHLESVDTLVKHILQKEPGLKDKVYKSKSTFFEKEILDNANPRNRRRTPLQFAVIHKRPDLLEVFLNMGANIDAKGSKNTTALHVAVVFRQWEMAETLIKLKADVHAKDYLGDTALHEATKLSNFQIVSSLLGAGADVNSKGFKDQTPLHLAAAAGSLDILRLLLEQNADVNAKGDDARTPLHEATSQDKLEVIRLLVDHGAQVNCVEYTSTPLHAAVAHGNVEIVNFLISKSADICAKNKDGDDALLANARRVNCDIVKLFLENGYDINTKGNNKTTLLMAFARWRDAEHVKYLLEKGAKINERDGNGNAALHKAMVYSKAGMIDLLIEHGADVNAQNDDGNCPLKKAIFYRKVKSARNLLKAGAHFWAANKRGETAIHSAAKAGCDSAVSVLLDQGADVNSLTPKNVTPLHLAALENKWDCCRTLLLHGARVNALDDDGKTPLLNLFKDYNSVNTSGVDPLALFLRQNVQLHVGSSEKTNALHFAVLHGKIGVLKLVLDRGIHVNSKDEDGNTPLILLRHLQPEKAAYQKAHLLLDYGADVLARNNEDVSGLKCVEKWLYHYDGGEEVSLRMYSLAAAACTFRHLTRPGETERHRAYYYDDCEEQSRSMERTKLCNGDISLLDTLMMSIDQLAKCLKNEKFKKTYATASAKHKIYDFDLRKRLRQAKRRNILIRELESSPFYVAGKILPALATREVLNYLSNQDLECFRDARAECI